MESLVLRNIGDVPVKQVVVTVVMLFVNGKVRSNVVNLDFGYFQAGVHLRNMGIEPVTLTIKTTGKEQDLLDVIIIVKLVSVENSISLADLFLVNVTHHRYKSVKDKRIAPERTII